MTDKLSRRDFLKVAAVGLGAAALTNFEIAPRIQGEIPLSSRISNGLRVCSELANAEITKDPEKIVEARKLAVVWMFAESASMFAKEAGMEKSGLTMEHYLYGNGQDLDISSWFKEVVGENDFWLNLTKDAFRYLHVSQGGSNDLSELSQERFLKIFDQLKERFHGGYAFASMVEQSEDWKNAIGASTYTMQCGAQIIPSENQLLLKLKDMNVRLFDKYDWNLSWTASISDKAGFFTSEVSKPLTKWLLDSENQVNKVLENISFPTQQREIVVNAIDSIRKSFNERVSDVPSQVLSAERWAMNNSSDQISERDINLLKKLGARDYGITAVFHHPGIIEIPTSFNNYFVHEAAG